MKCPHIYSPDVNSLCSMDIITLSCALHMCGNKVVDLIWREGNRAFLKTAFTGIANQPQVYIYMYHILTLEESETGPPVFIMLSQIPFPCPPSYHPPPQVIELLSHSAHQFGHGETSGWQDSLSHFPTNTWMYRLACMGLPAASKPFTFHTLFLGPEFQTSI